MSGRWRAFSCPCQKNMYEGIPQRGLLRLKSAFLSAWTGAEVSLPFDPDVFDRELARRVEMETKMESKPKNF